MLGRPTPDLFQQHNFNRETMSSSTEDASGAEEGIMGKCISCCRVHILCASIHATNFYTCPHTNTNQWPSECVPSTPKKKAPIPPANQTVCGKFSPNTIQSPNVPPRANPWPSGVWAGISSRTIKHLGRVVRRGRCMMRLLGGLWGVLLMG